MNQATTLSLNMLCKQPNYSNGDEGNITWWVGLSSVGMIIAAHSKILPHFNENFSNYLSTMECYFGTSNTKDKQNMPSLIASLLPVVYDTLGSPTCPAKPSMKSYADVTQLLEKHYRGEENHNRTSNFCEIIRTTNEKIGDYMNHLSKGVKVR